jgi:hypothetical protein
MPSTNNVERTTYNGEIMEMEMNIDAGIALGETMDRLAAAASLLEQTVERLTEKIAAAEQKLAALEVRAASSDGCPTSRRDVGSRKTLPTQMTTLLAKQGVSLDALGADSIEAGALDAALSSLSIEQRIAVKSQLLRAGLLS